MVDDKSFIWLSIPSLFYLFSFIFFPFLYFLLILCRNDYKVYFFYFYFLFLLFFYLIIIYLDSCFWVCSRPFLAVIFDSGDKR